MHGNELTNADVNMAIGVPCRRYTLCKLVEYIYIYIYYIYIAEYIAEYIYIYIYIYYIYVAEYIAEYIAEPLLISIETTWG